MVGANPHNAESNPINHSNPYQENVPMNRKYLFTAILIATLLLTGFAAQAGSSPVIAQEGPVDGPASPAADVSSSFTYQGYLQQNSSAVNGSCDFEFRLYNASGGGSQVGGLESRNGLAVSEGRFSAELDFGGNAFDGQGRWLEIRVRCPAGGGSYATLNPRQSLTAAPYALSLRPGASVNGSSGNGILNLTNNGGGAGLSVNSATTGVRVLSAADHGVLVELGNHWRQGAVSRQPGRACRPGGRGDESTVGDRRRDCQLGSQRYASSLSQQQRRANRPG